MPRCKILMPRLQGIGLRAQVARLMPRRQGNAQVTRLNAQVVIIPNFSTVYDRVDSYVCFLGFVECCVL